MFPPLINNRGFKMLLYMAKTVVSGGQKGATVIVYTVLTFRQK